MAAVMIIKFLLNIKIWFPKKVTKISTLKTQMNSDMDSTFQTTSILLAR